MENGILRSNRKAIGSFFRPFAKDDPRLGIALEEPEPKVHFALVCGAKSCPPIKTYEAKVFALGVRNVRIFFQRLIADYCPTGN